MAASVGVFRLLTPPAMRRMLGESFRWGTTVKSDIRRSERGGNAAYLNVGVWYQKETGEIHLTLPNSGWFHTTVNDKPNSKRGHPNLFNKLARALKEKGVPGPAVQDKND